MAKENRTKSTTSVACPPVQTAPVSRWFYGSTFDLLAGCAGWSAPVLVVAYLLSANHPEAASVAFYSLALVFNYPHYMATIYRAYRTPGDFHKYRLFTFHLTLLVGLLLVLAHVSYQLLALTFTLYLTWSPFHYTGQNFGIALMFARRNGVKTTPQSRRMFYLAFLASYLLFFLTIHSSPTNDNLILSLGIPLKLARIAWVGVFTTFLIAVLYSLATFVKQTNWRAMFAPVVLLSTQVFWFVIPTAVTLFTEVDFVRARSTAGVLAILHSAQYLWITSYYAKRETSTAENSRTWRPLVYFAVLVVGGIALFVPGPWLVSRLLHRDFTTSFLAFTALVNIHHFLLDGAIWKLRDGRIASLLLNTSQNVSEGARSQFQGLFGWLTSTHKHARLARVAAAVALLLVAGLDQAKFYLGAQASNSNSLQRAQQLNPYDSALQLKVAMASDREGNYRANRLALEEAVRMNPNSRGAQSAFAKLLIEMREYDQAYAHYKQMFTLVPPDVDSLINFGLLASGKGNDDEAIEAWQRAISLDEKQASAHLYLAEALIRKRRFKDAIPRYEDYLALIASETANGSSDAAAQPEIVINAILKLAAAYQNTNDNLHAAQFYSQAAALAESTQDRQALVFALVHAAEMKAKQGQQREALNDFTRALAIENSVNELGRPADWVMYARFLRQTKAPGESIIACYLKAQALIQAGKSPNDSEIPDLKRVIEKELNSAKSGVESAQFESIQNNLDQKVQEALAVEL